MFLCKLNVSSNYLKRSVQRHSSTIYALSSGQGKCGVAVLRISGSHAGAALQAITKMKTLPEPRRATLKYLYEPNTNNILDKGLILWFPGPRSFTGEDCCELQVHGGIAVVAAILKTLASIKHLRLAEPGEFTKRAFYFGKLDLTEVEGLADLLQAETEFQRRQAFLQTDGLLSKHYNVWRTGILKCVAHIEAYIDFDETENLDNEVLKQISANISEIREQLSSHLNDSRKGEILRNGVKTVILGEPNVGKSTLLNMLCNRPAAIVTPIAGTTRDILEVNLDINGYPLVLADTAGLRLQHTDDLVEKEGINRALNSITTADFILFVIDSEKYCSNVLWEINSNAVKSYLISLTEKDFIRKHLEMNKPYLVVFNKKDLLSDDHENALELLCKENPSRFVLISCQTEKEIQDFLDCLSDHLKAICGNPSKEHPVASQNRHRVHLSKCVQFLESFEHRLDEDEENCNLDIVLMAEDLRKALGELGKLTGKVTTEQILDVIFKDFCIGK